MAGDHWFAYQVQESEFFPEAEVSIEVITFATVILKCCNVALTWFLKEVSFEDHRDLCNSLVFGQYHLFPSDLLQSVGDRMQESLQDQAL